MAIERRLNKGDFLILTIVIIVVTGVFTFFFGKKGQPSPSSSPIPSSTQDAEPATGNSIGDMASLFRLVDYSGIETTNTDFRSLEGVVLYFWDTSCGTCAQDLSLLARVQDAYPGQFVPLAINRGNTADAARAFSDQAGVTNRFPELLDPSDSVYYLFGGYGMPYWVFIDKTGYIRATESSSLGKDILKADVEKII